MSEVGDYLKKPLARQCLASLTLQLGSESSADNLLNVPQRQGGDRGRSLAFFFGCFWQPLFVFGHFWQRFWRFLGMFLPFLLPSPFVAQGYRAVSIKLD